MIEEKDVYILPAFSTQSVVIFDYLKLCKSNVKLTGVLYSNKVFKHINKKIPYDKLITIDEFFDRFGRKYAAPENAVVIQTGTVVTRQITDSQNLVKS